MEWANFDLRPAHIIAVFDALSLADAHLNRGSENAKIVLRKLRSFGLVQCRSDSALKHICDDAGRRVPISDMFFADIAKNQKIAVYMFSSRRKPFCWRPPHQQHASADSGKVPRLAIFEVWDSYAKTHYFFPLRPIDVDLGAAVDSIGETVTAAPPGDKAILRTGKRERKKPEPKAKNVDADKSEKVKVDASQVSDPIMVSYVYLTFCSIPPPLCRSKSCSDQISAPRNDPQLSGYCQMRRNK